MLCIVLYSLSVIYFFKVCATATCSIISIHHVMSVLFICVIVDILFVGWIVKLSFYHSLIA